MVGLQENSRSDSGFKSLSFGLACNIKQLFSSDHFYFNFFFFLFLLLITFTNNLRQYPVIGGKYPTYPALERCKGRGRGRTFGAKFLFCSSVTPWWQQCNQWQADLFVVLSMQRFPRTAVDISLIRCKVLRTAQELQRILT